MTTPSLAEAHNIASALPSSDRERLLAFITQAGKIALVANQLVSALDMADRCACSNAIYCGELDREGAISAKQHSLAALKAYSEL